MADGYISRLVAGRGFGFIVEDGCADELEFHWSELRAAGLEQLQVGQRVQFDKQPDPRDEDRIRAINVRLIGRP